MNLRALVWTFPPSRSRHAGGCPEPPNRTAHTRERRSATAPPPSPARGSEANVAIQGRPAAFRTRPARAQGTAASKNHAWGASARRSGRVGLGRAPPAKRIRGGISALVPVGDLSRARKKPPPMRRKLVGIVETRGANASKHVIQNDPSRHRWPLQGCNETLPRPARAASFGA